MCAVQRCWLVYMCHQAASLFIWLFLNVCIRIRAHTSIRSIICISYGIYSSLAFPLFILATFQMLLMYLRGISFCFHWLSFFHFAVPVVVFLLFWFCFLYSPCSSFSLCFACVYSTNNNWYALQSWMLIVTFLPYVLLSIYCRHTHNTNVWITVNCLIISYQIK